MVEDRYSTNGLDPSAVVLRQDEAFGDTEIDVDLWLTTMFFPMILLINGKSIVLRDREDAIQHLNELNRAARSAGVAALRTRILSHLHPAPDLAIICSIRDRIAADGKIMASSSMTWTLMCLGSEWKISQINFDEEIMDRSMTGLIHYPNKQ